jgi:hypothetical protein
MTTKRSVWQVASDVRKITREMNMPRWYPEVDLICFIGVRSVQLEIRSPVRKDTERVVNTLIAKLRKRYPEWREFFQVRYENGLAVIVIDEKHIKETY